MSWKEIIKAENSMKDKPYYFLSNSDEIHTKSDKSMGLNISIKRGISFDKLKGVWASVSFKNDARDWDSVYRETMNYLKENPFLLNLEELIFDKNKIPIWKIEEKTLFVPIGYLERERERYDAFARKYGVQIKPFRQSYWEATREVQRFLRGR